MQANVFEFTDINSKLQRSKYLLQKQLRDRTQYIIFTPGLFEYV